MTSGAPTAPIDAYRASVAVEVLEARRSRRGERCAASAPISSSAGPGELAAASVRAYLRAKARARL